MAHEHVCELSLDLRQLRAPAETPVEIGLSDGLQTEVLTGLDEGDRVLLPESMPLSGRR